MSSGKTHGRVTTLSTFAFAGIHLYQFADLKAMVFIVIGGLFNLLASPDMDVDLGSRSDYHARKFKLGWLFTLIRTPYSISYKHRSKITHWPLISTLWRILYLYLPIVVLLTRNQPGNIIKLVLSTVIAQIAVIPLVWLPTWYFWYFLVANVEYLGLALISLMIADALHWVWDLF